MSERSPSSLRERQFYELITVKAEDIRVGDLFTQFSPEMYGFGMVTSVRRVGDYVEIVEDDDDRDLYDPGKEFQILRPVLAP